MNESFINHKRTTDDRLKEITIKLPENGVEHLERLEKFANKKKDGFIQESLYRQLEDLEDYEIGVKALEDRNNVVYTSEEVSQKLKEQGAKKTQKNINL